MVDLQSSNSANMKWKECLREPDMDIQDKIKLIVLAGPTAVGKTEFAIEIAKRLDGEIVNCDSMQIYKHMDIGSAKPTKKSVVKYLIISLTLLIRLKNSA